MGSSEPVLTETDFLGKIDAFNRACKVGEKVLVYDGVSGSPLEYTVNGLTAEGDALLIIGMSACLAGAVCGDHCSPISDTTIMSSAGGQCNHLNHVSTQMPYSISVAAISFVMYVVSAFVKSAYVLLPLGSVIVVGFLAVMKKMTSKQN